MRVDLEQRVEHDPRRATDDRLEQGHGHELEDGGRVHVHVHLVRVRVRVRATIRVTVRVRIRVRVRVRARVRVHLRARADRRSLPHELCPYLDGQTQSNLVPWPLGLHAPSHALRGCAERDEKTDKAPVVSAFRGGLHGLWGRLLTSQAGSTASDF